MARRRRTPAAIIAELVALRVDGDDEGLFSEVVLEEIEKAGYTVRLAADVAGFHQTGDGAEAPGRASDGVSSVRGPEASEVVSGLSAPSSAVPLRFYLLRHTDVSKVSGTGVVAWGVQFPDGSVAVRWHGDHPSTVAWGTVGDAIAVHGHSGATELCWMDDGPIELWPAEPEQVRRTDWWHVTDATPTGHIDTCMATQIMGESLRQSGGYRSRPFYHLCRMDTGHAGDHLCCACDHRWPRAAI